MAFFSFSLNGRISFQILLLCSFLFSALDGWAKGAKKADKGNAVEENPQVRVEDPNEKIVLGQFNLSLINYILKNGDWKFRSTMGPTTQHRFAIKDLKFQVQAQSNNGTQLFLKQEDKTNAKSLVPNFSLSMALEHKTNGQRMSLKPGESNTLSLNGQWVDDRAVCGTLQLFPPHFPGEEWVAFLEIKLNSSQTPPYFFRLYGGHYCIAETKDEIVLEMFVTMSQEFKSFIGGRDDSPWKKNQLHFRMTYSHMEKRLKDLRYFYVNAPGAEVVSLGLEDLQREFLSAYQELVSRRRLASEDNRKHSDSSSTAAIPLNIFLGSGKEPKDLLRSVVWHVLRGKALKRHPLMVQLPGDVEVGLYKKIFLTVKPEIENLDYPLWVAILSGEGVSQYLQYRWDYLFDGTVEIEFETPISADRLFDKNHHGLADQLEKLFYGENLMLSKIIINSSKFNPRIHRGPWTAYGVVHFLDNKNRPIEKIYYRTDFNFDVLKQPWTLRRRLPQMIPNVELFK